MGIRMLVSKKTPCMRECLCQLLSMGGARINSTGSWRTTKTWINLNAYDWILIGNMYEDGRGLDLLDHIRKKQPRAKVIFATCKGIGCSLEETREIAYNKGIYKFLEVPLCYIELYDTVFGEGSFDKMRDAALVKVRSQFGQDLLDARTQMSLSAEIMAPLLGVSINTLNCWENGLFFPEGVKVWQVLEETAGLRLGKYAI